MVSEGGGHSIPGMHGVVGERDHRFGLIGRGGDQIWGGLGRNVAPSPEPRDIGVGRPKVVGPCEDVTSHMGRGWHFQAN